MLKGLEGTDYLDEIEQEFSPGVIVNNEELAEKILETDDEKRRKFFETFEIRVEDIRGIAKKLHNISNNVKKEMGTSMILGH